MNSNLRQRLVLLLADPAISENELRSLESWLTGGGLSLCFDDARSVRNMLRGHREAGWSGFDRRTNRPSPPVSSDSLVVEIDRLLRQESNLTVREALDALQEEIGVEMHLPEKISFAEGILRLSRLVGRSDLLAIAHRLRNSKVHRPTDTAWPLDR